MIQTNPSYIEIKPVKDCGICLDEESPDNPLVSIPGHDLRHLFHQACRDQVLRTSGRCPLCMKVIDSKALKRFEDQIGAQVDAGAYEVPLIDAAMSNHADRIRRLLDQGNISEEDRRNAIIEAAKLGHTEVVNALIQNDIDRSFAIAWAPSADLDDNQVESFVDPIAECENREHLWDNAIRLAAMNNLEDSLDFLIQSEEHRALAMAWAGRPRVALIRRLALGSHDIRAVFNSATEIANRLETDDQRRRALAALRDARIDICCCGWLYTCCSCLSKCTIL